MKVYELMTELARMNAGAEVKFHRLASKDEVPKNEYEAGMYDLDFVIRQVEECDDRVLLDGWFE